LELVEPVEAHRFHDVVRYHDSSHLGVEVLADGEHVQANYFGSTCQS
jgi:hypothetical protein